MITRSMGYTSLLREDRHTDRRNALQK